VHGVCRRCCGTASSPSVFTHIVPLHSTQDEVLCLCSAGTAPADGHAPVVCSGSADHMLHLWDASSCILLHAVKHPCIVLAVAASGNIAYSSCGNGEVKVWDLSELLGELVSVESGASMVKSHRGRKAHAKVPAPGMTTKGALLSTLRQFISYRSVSSRVCTCRRGGAKVVLSCGPRAKPDFRPSNLNCGVPCEQAALKGDCWRCAKFLQTVFARFGADCRLVQVCDGCVVIRCEHVCCYFFGAECFPDEAGGACVCRV